MSSTHKHDSSEASLRDGPARKSGEGSVMELEQRGRPGAGRGEQQANWKNAHDQTKPFVISPEEVRTAWQRVRAKGGKGGVDGESLKSFEEKLDRNLYKLWNRMSSGSYHPHAVLRVEIPKKDGKKRPLGIPTIEDRVAQEVVRARFEPEMERIYHRDSYGFRPNRSPLEAVQTCRERCWKYDWVLDVDIQKFFDTIDHELMMKAVEHHNPEKWMTLYIKRWLKAPVQHVDGRQEASERGTPQGGVISPMLANLYLHYAFDRWMERSFPEAKFERYADDIVIHCVSHEQSKQIEQALAERLKECGLTLHPEKTKIVYCKDGKRKGWYPTKKFTFLGYAFQPRAARNKTTNKVFTSFLPAVSMEAGKKLRDNLKRRRIFQMRHLSIETLAAELNPIVRGWYAYFSRFFPSALYRMDDWLNRSLIRWLKAKFALKQRAAQRLFHRLARHSPTLFEHWRFRASGRAV